MGTCLLLTHLYSKTNSTNKKKLGVSDFENHYVEMSM